MNTRERRVRLLQLIDEDGSVSINDLAHRFGVSAMTVRRDVDQLAAEGRLRRVRGGATVSTSGPALGTAASVAGVTIGVVIPTTDYIYRSVLAGVDRSLRHAGATSTLRVSNYSADQERVIVEQLLAGGLDGLLFGPTIDAERIDPEQLDWLAGINVPLVLLDRSLPTTWPGGSVSSVRSSFARGLTLAVAHLVELGHTGIAFFGHARRMDLGAVRALWSEILGRFCLDPDRCPLEADRNVQRWQSDLEPERVLSRLRDAGATALVCRDDTVALTMAQCAQRLGIDIPGELSLMAYDDELASMCQPPLTAISTPKAALGERAVDLLLEHIRATALGHTCRPIHLEMDPTLVVRSSTGPPPTP